MKIKLVLLAVTLLLLSSAPVFAGDLGEPDSLILVTSRPNIAGNDSTMVVELYAWNDANDAIIAITAGFEWDSLANDMHIDSAVVNPSLPPLLFLQKILVDGNDYDMANDSNRFQFVALGFGADSLDMSQTRQLLATYYFTLDGWSGTDSVVLDSSWWGSGVNLKFDDVKSGAYVPNIVLGNSIKKPLVVKDPSDVQDDNDLLPITYSLMQNYPNPFNPKTSIQFDLAKSSDYTLTIFNVLGQKVDEFKEYGERGRQTIEWDANRYASGIYFYKLETKEFVDTKKMVLLK